MMIGFFKGWITAVVGTVIFAVLVDIILPQKNNFAKYARLTTGLIVIITILTPIFKLFDSGTSIETYISHYTSTYNSGVSSVDKKEVEKSVQTQTLEIYKTNLSQKIEQEIQDNTGKKYSVSRLEVIEDVDSLDFCEIKYVELKEKVDNKTIKPVEKIVISNNTTESNQEFKDPKVLAMLKDRFNISSSVVKFVK
jgi:stage III sporulation protein AF